MPSSGYKSCPLCNRNFDKEKTGHDATKYLEYEKRKQEIAELRTANAKLLSTTTEQIVALKRQRKDKEREIESLKKRQSREQQKNVQLSNTKIQRVGEGKSLTKSAHSPLRASKPNVLKTNLLKTNESTRKKTLSPLSKNMQSKGKQTAVKQQNNIKKVSTKKTTLLQQISSKQKNAKKNNTREQRNVELVNEKIKENNTKNKQYTEREINAFDKALTESGSKLAKSDMMLTDENFGYGYDALRKASSPKVSVGTLTNDPRPKDASSNKEFSEFQSNEQSRSDKINGSYVNLNSNSINRYMK